MRDFDYDYFGFKVPPSAQGAPLELRTSASDLASFTTCQLLLYACVVLYEECCHMQVNAPLAQETSSSC